MLFLKKNVPEIADQLSEEAATVATARDLDDLIFRAQRLYASTDSRIQDFNAECAQVIKRLADPDTISVFLGGSAHILSLSDQSDKKIDAGVLGRLNQFDTVTVRVVPASSTSSARFEKYTDQYTGVHSTESFDKVIPFDQLMPQYFSVKLGRD